MLRRLKLRLAARFDNPFVRLLVLDWRFSCLLFLLMGTVSAAVALPFRIWKRTPGGFTPEIRISTLDFIQAHALARSARKAEKRQDWNQARLSWREAFANDPCNTQIAADYIRALLRSEERTDMHQALQVALWLQSVFSPLVSYDLVIVAAERNQNWELILSARQGLHSVEHSPGTRNSVLRALFRTGKFREAKEFLGTVAMDQPASSTFHLYAEALDCILDPTAVVTDCAGIRAQLKPGSHNIEAYEIYLVTCAGKRDLREFQSTLSALKQITDDTLAFDALHVRLLLGLGRWQEAREVAARFRAPRSGWETFEIADALVAVGDRDGARAFLAGYRSEFEDSSRPLVLYARLLVQQARKKELAILRKELQERPVSPASALLIGVITCFLEESESARKALSSTLERLPTESSAADFWHLAAEALSAAGHARMACQLLLRIEPQSLNEPEYYTKLFAAAEAGRDATVMRHAAEHAYRLAPGDLRAVANYAAMLIMCEEQSDRALALTALCLNATPNSIAAKINHAAALINSDRIGSADLILRGIDEAALTGAARNQLRFIQLKRAAKLGDKPEILRLAPLLDKSSLYSVQLRWLSERSI